MLYVEKKWRIKEAWTTYAQWRYKKDSGLHAGDIVEIDPERPIGHLCAVHKIGTSSLTLFLIPTEYLEEIHD